MGRECKRVPYGLAHVNKINSRSRDLPGGSNLQGGGGGSI